MLILSKLVGILVLVWFYKTAKQVGAHAVKWAIIGLIGYALAWLLSREAILTLFVGVSSKNTLFIYFVTQIPVIFGALAAFFVRKKLISDEEKKN